MKKLLRVLIVFVLVYTGVTFAAGFYVKHKHDQLLAMIERDLFGSGVTIVDQSYVRGVWVSQSHLVVALPVNALLEKPSYLNIDSTIRSGPWLGGSDFGISKVDTVISPSCDEDLQSVLKFWQGQNIVTSETTIGFFKDKRNQTNILPLQYADGKVSIDFRGGTGQVDFSTANFSVPSFVYRDGDEATTIKGVRFQVYANAGFHGVLSVERIVAMNEKDAERAVDISDLLLDIRGERLLGDMLNSQVKGRMLLTQGKESAWFEMESVTQNMYQPALKQLREMRASVDHYLGSGNRSKEMERALLSLLVERPSMELNFSITQGGQTAYMRSSLGMDELSSSDRLSRNASLLMLTRGRAHAEVRIPRAMMESDLLGEGARLMVSDWLQMKLLLEEGANYVGEYGYGNQVLTVNKQRVSLF